MLVFLATPYSQLCDEEYNVKKEYKDFFEKLTKEIKKLGVDYFLAVERENYGKEYTSDKESTKIDFETIKRCDLLCVIPGVPASGGVHVELGWASANKKDIEIFLKKNINYSPMVTGLSEITNVNYNYYNKEYSNEVIELICESIKRKLK
jgi:hypothetical protein